MKYFSETEEKGDPQFGAFVCTCRSLADEKGQCAIKGSPPLSEAARTREKRVGLEGKSVGRKARTSSETKLRLLKANPFKGRVWGLGGCERHHG